MFSKDLKAAQFNRVPFCPKCLVQLRMKVQLCLTLFWFSVKLASWVAWFRNTRAFSYIKSSFLLLSLVILSYFNKMFPTCGKRSLSSNSFPEAQRNLPGDSAGCPHVRVTHTMSRQLLFPVSRSLSICLSPFIFLLQSGYALCPEF